MNFSPTDFFQCGIQFFTEFNGIILKTLTKIDEFHMGKFLSPSMHAHLYQIIMRAQYNRQGGQYFKLTRLCTASQ